MKQQIERTKDFSDFEGFLASKTEARKSRFVFSLYQRYLPLIKKLSYQFSFVEDREDIEQECYFHVIKTLEYLIRTNRGLQNKIKPESFKFGFFFRNHTECYYRAKIRTNKYKNKKGEENIEDFSNLSSLSSFEGEAEQKDSFKMIRSYLEPLEIEILNLLLQSLRKTEISEILGIPISKVHRTFKNIKRKLNNNSDARGYFLSHRY